MWLKQCHKPPIWVKIPPIYGEIGDCLLYIPLKNMSEFVSWDFLNFPTEWKVIKFHGSEPPSSVFH